ncbi:ATP-binding cassette domain-containing protein [Actinocrinis puniceicyclus]|uniref:ATP-binding cassette domain-containing protein n=1 Tax=Actinocrinis puniceicyclus TaxID=977794 RepID=A0A8J8BC48_9ACTN|nr:ATP-binding cassette domain-containing protein [Actinocrinis puniceicyclus]
MIEARGLAKTFKNKRGSVEAVRGLDVTVRRGEIVGFLGPNGAGKTTSLRMLTTLLDPTGGTAVVAGADLRREPAEVRRRIGYVAQAGGTDGACTVAEELITQAQLYRLGAAEARTRCATLLAQLDLDGLEQRLVKTLSGGQKRRLDIALGLVHAPRLVFLDEPTTGLDPQSRANLWTHVRKLRDELGTTVFLTTHYLDEADALCDRILIIDSGRIVAEGTPEELKHRISGDLVTVELQAERDTRSALDALRELDGVRDAALHAKALRLTVDSGAQRLMGIMRALDAANVPIASIQLAHPTLDDVFLTLTGRSLRDDSSGTAAPPDPTLQAGSDQRRAETDTTGSAR